MAGVKRKSLLDGEDDDRDGVEEQGTLKVNKAYAERFEHNKRREDLHRLQELQKKGIGGENSDESSDEEEDEDGLLPERVDLQIFETLAKIRKKHPSIYSADAKFYDEEEDGEESDEEEKPVEKKKKPLYLKDVIAKQLLEDGPEAKEEPVKPGPGKSYVQEQEELKRAFLQSVAEADGDDADGLFRVRKKTQEEVEKERKETEETVAEGDKTRTDVGTVIEEYFGNDTDLDENERFLKSYIQNQGWIDRESWRSPLYGDVDVGEDDDEEVEKQDRFEAEYNFRYQEEAGSQIQGHSRIVEGSVRKKPDQRKKQRLSKQERLTEQERARQEEVKRLKNVKKNELMERLEKIRSIAGADEEALAALGEDDLEEDFDPDEYDKKMAEAFGDAYYGGQDVDDRFNEEDADGLDETDGMEKPVFEAEDELLGLPEGWESGAKTGFSAVYAKQKKVRGNGTASASAEEKKTLKISLKDKVEFQKKLEEYYKLDYEDMVGDLPTRFKYTKVKPNLYGLRAKDILNADDQELSQYVSLKKLAPYRTEEWKVPPHLRQQRLSRKDRKKRSLDVVPRYSSAKEQKSIADANSAPTNTTTGMGLDSTVSVATKPEKGSQPNGEIAEQGNEISAKKKRKKRRRQKGPDLPMSRLLAYGKIKPPAKKQKKQKVAPSN